MTREDVLGDLFVSDVGNTRLALPASSPARWIRRWRRSFDGEVPEAYCLQGECQCGDGEHYVVSEDELSSGTLMEAMADQEEDYVLYLEDHGMGTLWASEIEVPEDDEDEEP